MLRFFAAAAMAALLPLSSHAMPEQLPTEVWADQTQVVSLDMSPDAKRIAMLMRRDRGADYEILVFDTDNISGTLKAIEAEGLMPQNLGWANDNHLVINFILEEKDNDGRPAYLNRTASYNVETEKWLSLVKTTNRPNPRDPMSQFIGQLGLGQVVNRLPDDPNHVLVSHTEKAGQAPNYYRTNVKTGARRQTLRGGARS